MQKHDTATQLVHRSAANSIGVCNESAAPKRVTSALRVSASVGGLVNGVGGGCDGIRSRRRPADKFQFADSFIPSQRAALSQWSRLRVDKNGCHCRCCCSCSVGVVATGCDWGLKWMP